MARRRVKKKEKKRKQETQNKKNKKNLFFWEGGFPRGQTSAVRHKGHRVAPRTRRVKHAAWNAWPHRAARAYLPGVYESRHIQHSSVGLGHSDVTLRRRAISSGFRLGSCSFCCLFATLTINIAQKNTVLAVPWSICFFLGARPFFSTLPLFANTQNFFSFCFFFFRRFRFSFFFVAFAFLFLFFSSLSLSFFLDQSKRAHQLSFAATSVAMLGAAPNSNNGCICASTVGPNWMKRENRS